jgi:hypothetical protein
MSERITSKLDLAGEEINEFEEIIIETNQKMEKTILKGTTVYL